MRLVQIPQILPLHLGSFSGARADSIVVIFLEDIPHRYHLILVLEKRARLGPGGYASRGLNYAIPEVRDHYMALIQEIAGEYDIEVIELDFNRFPAYFYRDNIQQHCATMTEVIAEVHDTVDATGRDIALMARIAATPGGALAAQGYAIRTRLLPLL